MSSYRRLLLILVVTTAFLVSTHFGLMNIFSRNNLKVSQAQASNSSYWKQKDIIVTMWNSAELETSQYATIAREKYNLILMNNSLEKLDVANKNGIKGIFGHGLISPASLHDPIKRKELDELIDKAKRNRALEAYYIADEPSAKQFSDYAELVDYLHKKDPSRLAYINLLPTYASEIQLGVSADSSNSTKVKYPRQLHGIGLNNKTVLAYLKHLRQFVSTVKPDLISYDHYHLFKNGDSQQYFLNLALISQVARESNLPFMNIIQAGRYIKDWRLPTAKEVRFQVYTTLAYGGRGISYFTYWGSEADEGIYRNGKPSLLAQSVADLNAEIHNMSPTLMSLESQGVYHTKSLPLGGEEMSKNSPVKVLSNGEFVVGMFGKGKKTSAFMIANRSFKSKQKAELTVGIVGGKLQELDRKTGKWLQIANLSVTRKFKITLDAGDGRLFRVI
jgi:hypothetical protein